MHGMMKLSARKYYTKPFDWKLTRSTDKVKKCKSTPWL